MTGKEDEKCKLMKTLQRKQSLQMNYELTRCDFKACFSCIKILFAFVRQTLAVSVGQNIQSHLTVTSVFCSDC